MQTIRANVEQLQQTAAMIGQFAHSLQEQAQTVRSFSAEIQTHRFKGNAQRGLTEALITIEHGMGQIDDQYATLSKKLLAFADRLLAADQGVDMSGVTLTSNAMGGMTSASPHATTFPSSTAGSTSGIDQNDSFMNFRGSAGIGNGGAYAGFEGAIWGDSDHGTTTIGDVPIDWKAGYVLGEISARAEFDPLDGNAFVSAGATAARLYGDAHIGNDLFGVGASGEAALGEVNAWAGLRDGQFGASVGANYASISGEASASIAGMDVGVGAELGFKAELGMSIGDKVEVDLPFASISLDPPDVDEIIRVPENVLNEVGGWIGGDVGDAVSTVGSFASDTAEAVLTLGGTVDEIGSAAGSVVEDVGDFLGGLF